MTVSNRPKKLKQWSDSSMLENELHYFFWVAYYVQYVYVNCVIVCIIVNNFCLSISIGIKVWYTVVHVINRNGSSYIGVSTTCSVNSRIGWKSSSSKQKTEAQDEETKWIFGFYAVFSLYICILNLIEFCKKKLWQFLKLRFCSVCSDWLTVLRFSNALSE